MALPGGGAIYNPALNPLQSFLDYTHQTEDQYNAGVKKGYKWNGTGWEYVGGGTEATDAMKKFGVPMGDAKDGYFGKGPTTGMGAPAGPGGAVSGSMSSSASGPGGWSVKNQLSEIDNSFNNAVKQATEIDNEGLAGRGMLTGMVGQASNRRAQTPIELARMSAIERLGNQQQDYQNRLDFAKQQADWQRQLALMSGGKYSTREDNGLADILAGLLGGGGGGGGGVQNPGAGAPPPQQGGGAPAPAGKGPRPTGAMDLAAAYHKATGKWGTPSDHKAWADSYYGDVPMVPFKPLG